MTDTLFDNPPAVLGSETSEAAADAIKPSAAKLREQVRLFIAEAGKKGATDEEIQDGTGINPSTQRPRRVELCQLGIITDSNRKRKTKSGREAVVWIAAH